VIFKSEIKDRELQHHFQIEDFLTYNDAQILLSPRTKQMKTANQGSNRPGTFAPEF